MAHNCKHARQCSRRARTDNRSYIKGVAYQQSFTGSTAVQGADASGGYNDPLADPSGCKRDIPYLKQLETNVIRVYAINPNASHDECMSMMADAGIYVIADLSAPDSSINSNDPQWNDELYARYASVVDVLQGYENVMGFFAGNEVATQPNNTASAAFVKAAVRDMKSYIKSKGYRDIGVGYAANDNQYIRVSLADYFNCGDPSDAIDFYGYNVYSWCGDSSYTASGYDTRTQEFESYNIPAFFAEYGCNTVLVNGARPFTEVQAIYGPNMSPVWSGAIVYMYFQETNDYGKLRLRSYCSSRANHRKGLVSVSGNSVSTLQDFNNLKTQIAKVHPTGVQMSAYTPSNSAASCPAENSNWRAAATPLPPTPNKQLCSCMTASLSCVVNPKTSASKYGSLFNYACAKNPKGCQGFVSNGQKGNYGAYSMCDPSEQLSWALNEYYLSQNKASTACDFKGAARLQNAGSGGSNCKSLLQEAGNAGTGTVTSQPSGTGASGGSGSGSGSSSGGAASSSGAASAFSVPSMENGILPVALFATIAAVSGMGILLL